MARLVALGSYGIPSELLSLAEPAEEGMSVVLNVPGAPIGYVGVGAQLSRRIKEDMVKILTVHFYPEDALAIGKPRFASGDYIFNPQRDDLCLCLIREPLPLWTPEHCEFRGVRAMSLLELNVPLFIHYLLNVTNISVGVQFIPI